MSKPLKITLKIITIFAIFATIFLANLWLKTNDIENAKKIKNNLDPVNLELCEKQTNQYSMYLGCIEEEFGVGSYSMYFSASLFVFLSLLLFKPNKQYLFLTPIFTIIWMVLSGSVVKFFSIPVIHTVFMEGDIRVLDGLYFQYINGNVLLIFFIFFTSSIAGFIAYGLGDVLELVWGEDYSTKNK